MGLLKILQKGFDAVAKVLAWLLVKMGLWLAALYTIVFFVMCAVTTTKFTSVQSLFWALFLVSVVLGLWISLSLANRAKNKDKEERAVGNIPKVKKKNGKEDYEESRDGYVASLAANNQTAPVMQTPQPVQSVVYYPQPVQAVAPTYYAPPQYVQPTVIQPVIAPSAYQQPQYQQNSTNGASVFGSYNQTAPAMQTPQPAQPDRSMSAHDILFSQQPPIRPQNVQEDDGEFLKYPKPSDMAGRPADAPSPLEQQTAQPQPQNNYSDYSQPRTYRQTQPQQTYGYSQPQNNYYAPSNTNPYAETPKIYRTRTDPDVLIYEYNDRLDYYRKTPDGPVFERTVYKNRL